MIFICIIYGFVLYHYKCKTLKFKLKGISEDEKFKKQSNSYVQFSVF